MSTTSSLVRSDDPESQKPLHRRCRCLDYCLVLLVFLLTVAMVVGFLLKNTEQEINRSAQLIMQTVALQKNETKVKWHQNTVGNTFIKNDFSSEGDELVVGKTGLYYMFTQLALNCIDEDNCSHEEGVVSLSLFTNKEEEELLKLHIETNKLSLRRQLSSYTGGIKYLRANERIKAELKITYNYESWQLDQRQNFLGLFWISENSPQ